MIDLLASAPGKIIISGEYAVLADAPAVSMAVNRRALVRLRASETGNHRLSTIGYIDGSRRFRLRDSEVEWLDSLPSDSALSLFERVIAETGFRPDSAMSFEIDSRALADPSSGRKLGLGSSAAVAVALAAACRRAGGPGVGGNSPDAARAHRDFQHGRGSGVDIATSTLGGLIRYRQHGDARALDWPRSLRSAILWSGEPASTADRISGLDRSGSSATLRDLSAAARDAADAWQSSDARQVLSAMARFVGALSAFDAEHDCGIFGAGHADILGLTSGFQDLVYKPCGAGGGDVGMVFTEVDAELERFVGQAARFGFRRLDAGLDPGGVTVEEQVA